MSTCKSLGQSLTAMQNGHFGTKGDVHEFSVCAIRSLKLTAKEPMTIVDGPSKTSFQGRHPSSGEAKEEQ